MSGEMVGMLVADRFEVLDQVGVGGMGAVYRARDTHLERIVALKTMLPGLSDSEFDRFRREATQGATLSHPGVVQVYDFLTAALHDGRDGHFIVMEYVDGRSLRDEIDYGAEFGQLVRPDEWAPDVVRALAYAHQRGIVHRDIKPENILVYDNSTPAHSDFGAKIADFGIAFALGRTRLTTTTATSPGTLAYMAPERFTSDGEPSTATDVWSFGMVLLETLQGSLPFALDYVRIIGWMTGDEPIPKVGQSQLQPLLEQCLQRDARLRCTAEEAAHEIQRYVDGNIGPATALQTSTAIPTSTLPTPSLLDVDPRSAHDVPVPPSARPRLYWVNQGKSYYHEQRRGQIRASASSTNASHTLLRELAPGDVIIHYAHRSIQAVSVVQVPACEDNGGIRFAVTEYRKLRMPAQLSDLPRELLISERERTHKHSPFDKNGTVRQGYLFRISDNFYRTLVADFHDRWPEDLRYGIEPNQQKAARRSDALWWE